MTLVRRPVEIGAGEHRPGGPPRPSPPVRRREDLAERERQAEALRQNDRRKDEFLAMLAHELRNPLAAVNNAVTILKMSPDEESRDWASDVVERQVRQLTRLIDDLLDVSRITSGKIRLRKEFVDAGPILDQAIESARPLIDERSHTLSVSIERGRLPLHADATRVEQIVLNLLTNAAKYTEAGGRIWLTAEPEGDQVVIRVRDNGTGIPPERLPEMFELFAQGDRSLARSEGGLGIGLTHRPQARRDARRQRRGPQRGPGPGQRVHRPAPAWHPKPAEAGPEARPGPSGDGDTSRILVVDDNEDTAQGMVRLLELLGNEVRTATTVGGPRDGPRRSGRISSSWTSACRGWTATRWPRPCARMSSPGTSSSSPSRATARRTTGGGRSPRGSTTTWSSPWSSTRSSRSSIGRRRASAIASEVISLRVPRTSLHARDESTRRPRRRPSHPAPARGRGPA